MWLSLFSLLADVQLVDKGPGTLMRAMTGSADYRAGVSVREEEDAAVPSAKILVISARSASCVLRTNKTSSYLWWGCNTECSCMGERNVLELKTKTWDPGDRDKLGSA